MSYMFYATNHSSHSTLLSDRGIFHVFGQTNELIIIQKPETVVQLKKCVLHAKHSVRHRNKTSPSISINRVVGSMQVMAVLIIELPDQL